MRFLTAKHFLFFLWSWKIRILIFCQRIFETNKHFFDLEPMYRINVVWLNYLFFSKIVCIKVKQKFNRLDKSQLHKVNKEFYSWSYLFTLTEYAKKNRKINLMKTVKATYFSNRNIWRILVAICFYQQKSWYRVSQSKV